MNRDFVRIAIGLWLAALAALPAPAQSSDVRRLYYDAPERPAANKRTTSSKGAQPVAARPAIEHLGLRYQIMLVDAQCNGGRPVDPDRDFRTGEHFTLSFEPNAAGYLYILSLGTDGNWKPLLPSFEMADENNFVAARQRIAIPKRHCFTVEPPPGVDRMFVVLARNTENVAMLNQAIQAEHAGERPARPNPPARRETVEVASAARLNQEVEQLRRFAADRNIGITKGEQPSVREEPPHSVFTVSTSPQPVDRIVLELKIMHQ